MNRPEAVVNPRKSFFLKSCTDSLKNETVQILAFGPFKTKTEGF